MAVRYDPFDAGVAYAYLPKERRWVECRSDYYALLQGRSERELLLIAEELRRARRDHGARTTITAKQLAAFGARVEDHERIVLQRDRDAETRTVLSLVQGGQRSPSSAALTSEDTRPAAQDMEGAVVSAAKPKILPRLR